ncbi:MAG: ABC-F family ATP-binding cassette domain-containing protein [Acidobacteria bacterium]|nr:ABC-F family ATP-binding cassette domain-containing protein [Acidobacteriota bacterium]
MLTLDGVGRTVAGRTLFRQVNWTVHAGERVGLVGPNGSGKTTLLRILAGFDEPDEGQRVARSGLRAAYLPQEVEAELSGEATILEAALAAADDVRALGAELEHLAERMAHATHDPELLDRLSHEYGERRALFEWAGGDALESRARTVLGGLGFGLEEMERPVRTFSGGWRMRALMARLLLSGADVLLLDEPTNHLDLDALAWLENHLASSPAALVVVSHDRVFLDRVATRIADIAGERLRITKGGYTKWLAAVRSGQEQAQRRLEQLEDEARRLEQFVERFHAKATKAAQARDRARMLEDVREEQSRIRVEVQRAWRLRWPDPPPTSDLVVTLESVRKRYGTKVVLDGVDLQVRRSDRIAVMGPNGAGKTTLLRIVGGELLPEAGRREVAPGLLIGSFAQHQLETMDPDRSVLDEASRTAYGRKPEEVRRALGALGLGELHVDRPVRTLSGGERARLALARLMLRPASLLLLDEPTNHLDLPLREALEEALAGWPGALLVVSHDRAFLERLTTRTIAVEDGAAEGLDGGWRGWLEWRAARREARRAADAGAGGEPHERSRLGRRARAEALQERNRRLRPLRENVERLEGAISAAEERLREVDAALADPATHADGERMRSLARERDALERELAALYPEWEHAAHVLEQEQQ